MHLSQALRGWWAAGLLLGDVGCTTLGSSRLVSGSSSPGWREISTAQRGQLSDAICRDQAEEMAPSVAGLTQAIITGQNHSNKTPGQAKPAVLL